MIYDYTRLRYQVSVYRTIGPLVYLVMTIAPAFSSSSLSHLN